MVREEKQGEGNGKKNREKGIRNGRKNRQKGIVRKIGKEKVRKEKKQGEG